MTLSNSLDKFKRCAKGIRYQDDDPVQERWGGKLQRMITLDILRVDCNIGRLTIQDLTIKSRPGEHTIMVVDALPELGVAGYASSDISGQPISVRVKGSEDEILFYGVIFEATECWNANFLSLRITAYSMSWLLDLEKKSRSFQKVQSRHSEIMTAIMDDYGSHAIYNFDDKPIGKPYIQYNETDWEFIRRISSRMGAQVIPSERLENPGLYIGFPEKSIVETIESTSYRFGINDEFVRNRGGNKNHYIYYEIEDFQPRQIGDLVKFQGAKLAVCEASARLDKGVLRFFYRLAGTEYNKMKPEYNESLRGLSLIGTVLERKAEKLRIHLEIDEEQSVEDAYYYTWLPETGNIMYNMPPMDTRVSLYMQNADEHSAICIRNVRDNGTACALTQDTSCRYLTTEPKKSLSMKPETMDIIAMQSGDCALIDDNFGCMISSGKEVFIQASGDISIRGNNLNMQAAKEMTTVRRDLVQPTVMNICHNVDTTGGKGQFQATGKYLKPSKGSKGELTQIECGSGEAQGKAEQERRKKLEFAMAELQRQMDSEPRYDITDVFQTVLAAVPQRTEKDDLAKFSAGSRVVAGSWSGDVPVGLVKRVSIVEYSGENTNKDKQAGMIDESRGFGRSMEKSIVGNYLEHIMIGNSIENKDNTAVIKRRGDV